MKKVRTKRAPSRVMKAVKIGEETRLAHSALHSAAAEHNGNAGAYTQLHEISQRGNKIGLKF